MSSPDSARSHIYQQHQKEVEARNKSDQGREHIYNDANIEKYEKRGYQIVVKYAYVSCVDMFDTKPELARHVDKMHLIQPPPMPRLAADNHWELDGNNISKKFHAYRQSCFDKSKTASFTMDGNFNELLSMSGVLVLQKRYNYQSFPVDSFPPDLLRSMHAHVIGSYSRCTFNPQILCQVMAIIQKYTDGQIDEEKAKIDLLNCARIAETNERAVINAVVALISNLYDCDVKTLSEAHLAASYIHPFIHDLLPYERPDSDNRPDYKVDIYTPGYKHNYTNVYGEMKPTVNMSPTLIVNDFYRLAIFAKDALDIFHLR
ncbi:hypothetical protein G6F16_012283 [Rhizopus arrhizus]|nr:hypothetical protein G6F21_012166 [Rhizopus arrhizus]KAG0804993.1 hypothetical protein G6F20_012259 [Rhizopus arrhizus]KAG0821088.1 hypothetical protein G6F18_012336 [Rhizopus arrhizus]KAG0821138.1 hypothetical protein G6F19_012085 [Rhizopus arrhizus]KAG0862770.1 hypothetical protein G6F16_012283 [Rhizopus arrhizus]